MSPLGSLRWTMGYQMVGVRQRPAHYLVRICEYALARIN